MIHPALTRSMFFAGLMLSSTVFADPAIAIVKCIDNDGKVTLTDARCPQQEQTVAVVAGAAANAGAAGADDSQAIISGESTAEAAVTAPVVERYTTSRTQAQVLRRDLPVVRNPGAGGGLARDIATLKAARHSLMLQDSAAQAARSQRIAGLQ
ncbi:hypothetical protein LXA47_31695 [Massilia sp. P8910]|uniref:hypothetical protein n=1 Tax=Massilia antarctica TaxID=2765360 RepID=UPI00073E60CF|nr:MULTISPECIES: hypothetical protein [Massilia]MCE3608133.1 hypothetical protein [Massilia antarctica]MCY0910211.1 hypothetical protein [Massilia sp. H27-R4]